MTKTVEDVRRAAFEAWFTINYTAHKLSPRQTNCGILTNGYADSRVDLCWRAFNSALDAVEIQLPYRYTDDCAALCKSSAAYNDCHDRFSAAIEQTGLGLRVK